MQQKCDIYTTTNTTVLRLDPSGCGWGIRRMSQRHILDGSTILIVICQLISG